MLLDALPARSLYEQAKLAKKMYFPVRIANKTTREPHRHSLVTSCCLHLLQVFCVFGNLPPSLYVVRSPRPRISHSYPPAGTPLLGTGRCSASEGGCR